MRGLLSKRDARIFMDYLTGKGSASDVTTYWKLAQREGVSAQRIGQIINRAKDRVCWHPAMSVGVVGALLYRERSYFELGRAESPEEFYQEVENERRLDELRRFH